MAGAQVKVFAAIFALVILCGTLGGAYYAWEKIFKQEQRHSRELRQELSSQAPKADPGKPVYFEAVNLIKGNDYHHAREKLNQVIRIYSDSPLAADARRILGELNMDRLFSREANTGKLEFTVAREPGLEVIARKSQCTISYIRRINGLGKAIIHPGDRLLVTPLEFEIEINVTPRTLVLKHKGEFFKEYGLLDVVIVDGTKLVQKSFIESRQGTLGEKSVNDSDVRWPQARKWLQTKGRPGRPGVILCTPPKKQGDSGTFGIHLSNADIDELCTILRVGTPITFRP